MGLDYSYEVYIHRDRAADLLNTLADNMKAEGRADRTVVEIAGQRVVLPCTADFETGRTVNLDPSNPKREFLDLSLGFDPDDHLRAYCKTDDDEPCRVGYIYLSVFEQPWLPPDHLSFDFMAATTSMSKLFLESPSIRNWFASLTIDNAGPLCLLDVEQGPEYLESNYYYIAIAAGKRRIFEQAPGTRQAIFNRFMLS